MSGAAVGGPVMPGWPGLSLQGWPDIAVALTASGKPWPLAAIVHDVHWFAGRVAGGDLQSMPSAALLSRRWNVGLARVSALLSAYHGSAGEHAPPTVATVPLAVTSRELELMQLVDDREHVAARFFFRMAIAPMCEGSGRVVACRSRSCCPSCGAIVRVVNGRQVLHARAIRD